MNEIKLGKLEKIKDLRSIWKNEEYRVTLPYAKFEFWYSEASWSKPRASFVNESSCLRVQLKEA